MGTSNRKIANERRIIRSNDGRGIAGQKEPFTSTNYFENGKWDDDGDCVLAWMPLPEPYRPKDNKEKPAWGDWILGDFMKNSKGERL